MFFLNFVIFLLICILSQSQLEINHENNLNKIRYDQYKVYKLNIASQEQLSVMESLQKTTNKFKLWKEYDLLSKEIHIMIKPNMEKRFLQILHKHNIYYETLIDNVQELIDEEQQPSVTVNNEKGFMWNQYYQLDDIMKWLDNILISYANVTQSFTIGSSYEGRPIRGIQICYKPNNPGIFIESNIHAREWITSATATWFINELLTSKDEKVRNLVENYNWYIIPVLNVDGYVYTHEMDRAWRKTRQPAPDSNCIGTDPNRNFDFMWLTNNGASSNPCSDNYAGSYPFSSPEVKALAKFVANIKKRINIYLAFHSYSQVLLSPYGFSKEEVPENNADLMSIAKAFADAIPQLPYNTTYDFGSTAEIMYIASGPSIDWVYAKLGIKIAYTIEFRDRGQFGFVLPPSQIIPNAEELMAGLLALIDESKKLGYLNLKTA